jgi:hypothetical protein
VAALTKLTREIHSIDLQAPVFCTFENMLAFSPQERLNIVPPGSIADLTTPLQNTSSIHNERPVMIAD